uniref:Uncharacterized protein n=1 Tax=Anguilla anguilla TaxID=7936 RepID=A0A0E9PK53_ANGAN
MLSVSHFHLVVVSFDFTDVTLPSLPHEDGHAILLSPGTSAFALGKESEGTSMAIASHYLKTA